MSYACWLRISKCSFLSVIRRNCCFRAWKKSQGILMKGMFAWLIHFMVFDGCWWIWESDSILSGSHTGESVLALQVKLWKRGRVFEDEVFIENTCLRVGSLNAGRNSNEDVVLNTDHVVLLANGFPETEYLRASAIFVSGTSSIPPILNYRSVNPVDTMSKRNMWSHWVISTSYNANLIFSSKVSEKIFRL